MKFHVMFNESNNKFVIKRSQRLNYVQKGHRNKIGQRISSIQRRNNQ